jgi:serine/threonine protein kinase
MFPGNGGEEPLGAREIWPPGTTIKGEYVIEKKLGAGGFGSVYLARHRLLESRHVIKRLHEQYAGDQEFVRKFVNEGRIIRRLKGCPNIVEVEHMTQSEDGHPILIMEHVSGGDLAQFMAARPLSVREVIEAGRQIAFGLDAAHRLGLIHRDIKPQNVLISNDSSGNPVLKLIDFGLAKDHGSQERTSMMRGGSLGYTSPEQWMKAGKHIDGRADLYSLGATLYRLLCGRMPYDVDNGIGDWMEAIGSGPPIPPDRMRSDCPTALSALVLELLSVNPEHRPADAAMVIRRLDAIAHAPPPAAKQERVPAVTTRGVRNWVAIAGFAVVVSLGGWVWTMSHNAPKSAEPAAPVVTVPQPKAVDVPVHKPPEAKKKAQPAPAPKQEEIETRAAVPPPATEINLPDKLDVVVHPPPGAYLQVRAIDRQGGVALVEAYQKQGFPALLSPSASPTLFRVVIGPLKDSAAVAETKSRLRNIGVDGAILRRF